MSSLLEKFFVGFVGISELFNNFKFTSEFIQTDLYLYKIYSLAPRGIERSSSCFLIHKTDWW